MEFVNLDSLLWFQEGPGVRNYQYVEKGVKLINVTNLVNGKLQLHLTNRYISEEEAYGKYKHFMCDPGDLVIASSGITYDTLDKKNAFITKDDLPLCMNTSVIRFKPLDDKINLKFAYYFFKSKKYKKQISRLMTGSAQLNYGPSHLHKIVIPYYSIEQQNKIVEELLQVDKEIEICNKNLEQLDNIVKSQFIEMFDNCKNYKTFGEIMNICRGASPRPISQFITNDTNGINWIKIGDVDENSIYITATEEKITLEGSLKSRLVKKGDFILSNSMSFGRPYILGINGCVHDGWLILSEYEKIFNPLFLYYAIRDDEVQYQFNGKANGATVRNLNSELVRNTFIKVPPIELQNKFADFVKLIDKSKLIVSLNKNIMK